MDIGNTTEQWLSHEFSLSKTFFRGRRKSITVKIKTSGEDWGQLAIDKMKLWGNGKAYSKK